MAIQKTLKATLAMLFAGAVAVTLPALGSAARADEPKPAAADEGKPSGGNEAVLALTTMGHTLQAKQFSFTARTFRAYAGPNGQLLHIVHTLKTVVNRPNEITVDVTGDDGASKLLFDGKSLVLYVPSQHKYASAPVLGDIDKALDFAEEHAGHDFPLSDLLGSDPGQSMLDGVTSGGQVGTATIDGVVCRHFFFVQAAEDVEWEIWLEDNDRALPRRVVVTYRSLPGRPIFYAELSNWDLSTPTAEGDFEFKPAADVTRIDFAPRPSAAPAPKK
jgi:hypothetical protein